MDSERHIEKLLRAYAKKRRDAAGQSPQMHPATRRLLQGEVARRSPPRRAASGFGRFFGLSRPGLAFALCFIALAVVVSALVIPALTKAKSRSLSFARNDLGRATTKNEAPGKDQPMNAPPPAVTEEPAKSAPPPPATPAQAPALASYSPGAPPSVDTEHAASRPMPAAVETARDKELALHQSIGFDSATADRLSAGGGAGPATLGEGAVGDARRSGRQAEPAGVSGVKLANRSYSGSEREQDVSAATNELALNDQKSAATEFKGESALSMNFSLAASPTSAVVDEKIAAGTPADSANAPFSNSQRYVQQPPVVESLDVKKAKVASDGTAIVLNAFSLEQNGPEVRVIDSDGSVYRGTVRWTGAAPEVEPPTNQVGGLSNTAVMEGVVKSQTQNYIVSWSGLNRSLKQNVSFNGNLQAPGPTPALQKQNGAAIANGYFQVSKDDQSQLPLANSRIRGTAVINNTQQVQVNAVSASSPSP